MSQAGLRYCCKYQIRTNAGQAASPTEADGEESSMETAGAEINVISIELLQWIEDFAELAIHTDEDSMSRWKPVFDEVKREHPLADPIADTIFSEYWADKGTVVYWLETDVDIDEPYMLTDEIGSEKLDKLVIDAATSQQQA